MKNNIIRIKGLSLLFLIPFLLISGCGNKKKIRLHAPDSSAQRLSGRWVLADSTRTKLNGGSAAASPWMKRIDLNENHSAIIYKDDSASKRTAITGIWQLKKPSAKSGDIDTQKVGVILVIPSDGKNRVSLSIVTDQHNGDTILSTSNHFSFRKDK